jgi:hypothetical protein
VTKCASERGQISIFFASSLIVLISIIAFVINIGLFVKAKINLQNATDASAYAGAAVQARMLTRIGYMNWEMRNVYKEWMFKYYVLGNLNIDDVEDPNNAGDNISFAMRPDPNLSAAQGGNDIYNFPSVCLHYAGVPTNVCRRYAIPGIPRFEPTNLVGIDETTSSFIDAIVKEKSSDCSKRTQLNYNVTNMWAYNLNDGTTQASNAFVDAPQVAPDRMGAWPKAVELAIRTRSLEFAMNRAPISEGVCNPNTGQGSPGCRSVKDFESQQNYGNERIIKAYYSGMRNLGSDRDNEMRASYTMFELPPTQVQIASENSLSALLMSPDARNAGKWFVDLQLHLVNYATFFTALIARDDNLSVSGQTVKAEGACDVSKIAIPVPGYPLGFVKNPDVLTYYAVRGEARFQGLFNPFSGPVKLTAWAAAKPMGGRIGPALFATSPTSDTTLKSRTTANKKRSTAYLSGLDLNDVPRKGGGGTVPLGQYAPGMPIPINMTANPAGRFWIQDAGDDVGGWVSGPSIVFGIPNLVYDFDEDTTSGVDYQAGNEDINIIQPKLPNADAYSKGLYKKSQFAKFKQNLVGTADPVAISTSLTKVRAPTRYEAANYTVPVPSELSVSEEIEGGNMDTFGFITGANDNDRRFAQIYAPLYGAQEDAMYKNAPDVVTAIHAFMLQQSEAMKKYRNSMNRVAKRIFQDDPVKYRDAAERISNFDFSQDPDVMNPTSCKSITGSFLWFYFNGEAGFPITDDPNNPCPQSFKQSIETYFTTLSDRFNPTSHIIEYAYKDGDMPGLENFSQLLTGYMPGTLRGASQKGVFNTPFGGGDNSETMRRTGYSTKLVQLKSLTGSGNYGPGAAVSFAIYSEGNPTPLAEDVKQNALRNALDLTLSGVPSTINH